MEITRRLLLAMTGLAAAGQAHAQAEAGWPSRPITLIVPNPPGGGTDFAARLFQEALGQALGQPVVIENRSGGNGNVGILAAARAKPDGYTLLLQYSGYHGANTALQPDAGWDPNRDLAAVGMTTLAPHVIFAGPGISVSSLAELVAHIRENPGRVTYASAGTGSIQNIAGLQLAQRVGAAMLHVPYRGAAPALQDVVGGRVDIFITTPSSAMSLLKGGQIKALAVASAARLPALPDVPTTAEAGLPGYTVDAWFAVFAPAGTPAAVIEKVNAALRAATQSPKVQEVAAASGVVLTPLTVTEMDAMARRDVETLARVVREAGLRLE
ncbi:Bug family tripartite tricarboxylate transporter substrate binding protein [Teichococcus vastitatis]|uniref:Tripartite tricarboxylate transporter substrate binding protein n=1 Tax=Teichococcus vastitatis TaxID=2307076 RepID=A0ABS9WBP5_9PROT|nr:tripartite tricarboxylate transporter substrate binding protein [Pseudoroseomonas vastitatis]MCI0756310.1 tripartite tricarboxylate transporter substrate binding protein [Pseudoroseomonas vastitatis]